MLLSCRCAAKKRATHFKTQILTTPTSMLDSWSCSPHMILIWKAFSPHLPCACSSHTCVFTVSVRWREWRTLTVHAYVRALASIHLHVCVIHMRASDMSTCTCVLLLYAHVCAEMKAACFHCLAHQAVYPPPVSCMNACGERVCVKSCLHISCAYIRFLHPSKLSGTVDF